MSPQERTIQAFNLVFNDLPEQKSKCSSYTFQLALSFITLKSPKQNNNFHHGNCGSQQYYNDLQSILNYKQVKNATVTKQELIDDINNSIFPYGTVIAYQAIDKLPQSNNNNIPNAFKYGHTQFYIGPQTSSTNNNNTNNNSNYPLWSSSMKFNYNNNFVYNKINSQYWNYRVFIPPKELL